MSREPRYAWPMLTVVHPEHGSFRLHVHGVRKRGTGSLTLVAFGNGAPSVKQADLVRSVARGTGSEIVQLDEDDISESLGLFLAAKVHEDPETGVLIVAGSEWGLDGTGREVVHR